ncbi:MAG: prolyl oligopeptidase family serine peptidase [bacterium]|nr:prolyl oligopeptidase family serine peptidase [bacterium]
MIVALAMALVGGVAAQEEETMDRNSLVYDYFQRSADEVAPKLAWNAKTPAEHEAWRTQFDAKLRELVGRMPNPVPLAVEWAEETETDLFTRRKVYIQSEKDYWVPAYYFVPKNITGKRPAVICLHGHSGIIPYIREGTEKEREKSRDHALDYAVYMAEHGYVTLAVVQRGWNETRNEKPHSCHRVTMDSFLIGMTPVGLRCWDAMRCLDFLEGRDEVDADRIGAAGLSGGGTTTLFFTALEPRVKLAMVAGYFCTFRDSIFTIHHCICNCVPHIMEWGEMSDVGALIAPRPCLMISGDEDRIFPIDATKRAYADLAKTYKVLGASEELDSDFFEGEHQWSNRKSLAFLEKHFGALSE